MRTCVSVSVAFMVLLGACSNQAVGRAAPDGGSLGPPDTPEETSCFDGVDNDQDGLVDCADPSCGAIAACVAAVPAGWTGHAMLYDGDAAVPPGCSGLWTGELVAGRSMPSAPPASCSACACTAPSGGSCTPVGGDATKSAPSAPRIGIACTMTGEPSAGCASESCLPVPPDNYVPGMCIYQRGDVACPAGVFGDRHVFYASTLDTRDCAACACGAPSGGACAASGGGATGGVEGVLPTTFCCVARP